MAAAAAAAAAAASSSSVTNIPSLLHFNQARFIKLLLKLNDICDAHNDIKFCHTNKYIRIVLVLSPPTRLI